MSRASISPPFAAWSTSSSSSTSTCPDRGDFFATNRASPVSTDFALQELARAGRPAIICPGNHDCADPGSVYHRVDFSQAGEHVKVITDIMGERLVYEDLGVVVWGRAATERDPHYRPLEGLPPRSGDLWHIAIAHGHFMEDSRWERRWGPISEAELARADWDYLKPWATGNATAADPGQHAAGTGARRSALQQLLPVRLPAGDSDPYDGFLMERTSRCLRTRSSRTKRGLRPVSLGAGVSRAF
jgi:hypothetical protein